MGSEGVVPAENQIKVLYFSKIMDGNNEYNSSDKLKQKLDDETEKFLN